MLKISKTEFKRLHKNNKLKLFGRLNDTKEKVLAPLKKLYRSRKLCTQNTTNINIDNVKDYSKNTIFKSFPFVFVEVNITDKTYGKSNYTICYVIKKIKE